MQPSRAALQGVWSDRSALISGECGWVCTQLVAAL
ncbi:MAG: hypothetical protein JWO89_1387 [Verrucomicrobiaceae bacterium]|nr:hypothetical protein [Verrucomicrobiaceae bacterium]